MNLSLLKSKEIRTRKVTCDIEGHQFPVDLSQIQIRNEEFLQVEHWVKNIPRVGSNDGAASALDPLTAAGQQCGSITKLARQIFSRHHQTNRQNETSAFEGVVSAG